MSGSGRPSGIRRSCSDDHRPASCAFLHLYVVIRVDDFQTPSPPEDQISLVAAFRSAEAADRDAARLNQLSADRQIRYLVHLTRLKD
jgi:hypothetical protein